MPSQIRPNHRFKLDTLPWGELFFFVWAQPNFLSRKFWLSFKRHTENACLLFYAHPCFWRWNFSSVYFSCTTCNQYVKPRVRHLPESGPGPIQSICFLKKIRKTIWQAVPTTTATQQLTCAAVPFGRTGIWPQIHLTQPQPSCTAVTSVNQINIAARVYVVRSHQIQISTGIFMIWQNNWVLFDLMWYKVTMRISFCMAYFLQPGTFLLSVVPTRVNSEQLQILNEIGKAWKLNDNYFSPKAIKIFSLLKQNWANVQGNTGNDHWFDVKLSNNAHFFMYGFFSTGQWVWTKVRMTNRPRSAELTWKMTTAPNEVANSIAVLGNWRRRLPI